MLSLKQKNRPLFFRALAGPGQKALRGMLFAAAALALLSACAGREPHPQFSFPDDQADRALFIVEEIQGASQNAISVIKKKGLASSFILSLSACIKDRFRPDSPMHEGTEFIVKYETSLPGGRQQQVTAPAGVNGCIQWEEEYKYKYALHPKWITLARTIERPEGAFAGKSKIYLAVNPWLPSEASVPGILDLREQYAKSHKILKKYGREPDGLAYLSKTDRSEFPQLWAPALDLQLEVKPEQRGESQNISAALARYRKICGRESSQESCYRRILKMSLIIPLKIRSYNIQGQILDTPVNGGAYRIKSRLTALPDVQLRGSANQEKAEAWQIHNRECQADIDLFDKGEKRQDKRFVSMACDLNISYFNNNARYKIVLEIEPESGLPFKKFQGIYTVDLRGGIRHSAVTGLIMDSEIDEKYRNLSGESDVINELLNIKNIHDLADESRRQPGPRGAAPAAQKPSLSQKAAEFAGSLWNRLLSGGGGKSARKKENRFDRLGFRASHLDINLEQVRFSEVVNDEACADNESAVKRKVKFIGKACIHDALKDKKYRDTRFRVFIGKREPGAKTFKLEDVEEAFKDPQTKTAPKTDSDGCISWTDVIEHNIYDRQIYYVREMHFLSEDLNLYGKAYVALSPWQRAFQAYQDINQLSVDEIRTRPAGIDKPEMIINQFKSVNLFPSYIIDRLLNLHIYHNLYFLFQPFIERHDNLGLGRDHRARELIRDGYYITRILLIRNPQETGETQRILTPAQARASRSEPVNEKKGVQISGGEYLTHADTVIRAKANFLNLYMPLHLTTSKLLYLASRNLLVIQVVPADPAGFRFKPAGESGAACDLDLEKTVWRPYPSDKHELKNSPYAGAFNIQNWTNWNILQPQPLLNTDAIVEQSEIGRQYMLFRLSEDGNRGEKNLREGAVSGRPAPFRPAPVRLGEGSDCARELSEKARKEIAQCIEAGGGSSCAAGAEESLPEKWRKACGPKIPPSKLAFESSPSGPADKSGYSKADQTLADHAAWRPGNEPPHSPVRAELAALLDENPKPEELLKSFAEKNSLRLVHLSGEQGKRLIEDLGGFFEVLEKGRGLLTEDILPAIPRGEDRQRLRAEISESCGGMLGRIARVFSSSHEACVHEILLAYIESQTKLLKGLESEKWAAFFEGAKSHPEPWGGEFLETVPDEGARQRLQSEIAKACGFEESCVHDILAAYTEEKSRQFNDMEAYAEREMERARAGGFFQALSSLAGISGKIHHMEESPPMDSALFLTKPLKIYRQTAPYLMERPRMETVRGIIDDGITSQNSGKRDVLSFARSLCGFWFDSFLSDYLQPEQMISAYTDYVSRFDYYQVLESDWDQNDKSAFLESFLDMIPEDAPLRQCHKQYTQCILADHCELRGFSKLKQHSHCAGAPAEESACLKIQSEECAAAPHLSFCGEKSLWPCNAALNKFCQTSPDHRACRNFRSRCLRNYRDCAGEGASYAFFKSAVTNSGPVIYPKKCRIWRQRAYELRNYPDSPDFKHADFQLRQCLSGAAKPEPLEICERNPFEFFKFENKMIVHELAGKKPRQPGGPEIGKNPQYAGGFAETISVTGSFSTGSYMNWTAQRSTSVSASLSLPKIGLTHGFKFKERKWFGRKGNWLGGLKIDLIDIGGSISKGISSNESNSGRRAIDVRVNKSAFLTTSRATIDIGLEKFQKCMVIKPRPNAFFAKLRNGLWEAYPKSFWHESFQESDFRKVFVSRPGLMICNPPETRTPENPETIQENYYYTQALGNATNSQLLNLYDLANRPFMSMMRGRKEFMKFFEMMKISIEGDNGQAGRNASVNLAPENMFINYPHPVEEALGLNLSMRVFNETGFFPGIFNYADESDDLDIEHKRREPDWFLDMFEGLRNFNFFPLPAQPENRMSVQ